MGASPGATPGRRLPGGFLTVAGLGAAIVWLLCAAVIGAIAVGGDDAEVAGSTELRAGQPLDPATGQAVDPATGQPLDPATGQPIDPATGQPLDPATGQPVDPATGLPLPPEAVQPGTPDPNQPAPPPSQAPPPPTPGDRTGVSDGEVKYGLHAPVTINGAPLNLAEDPLTGVRTYLKFINDRGGIHGRKIALDLQDDRYTVQGGTAAGKALVANGNFFISGTLGVDQIAQVANEARKAGVPYMAAGGHEPQFAGFGVYQLGTSYDTHVRELARFLATDDRYRGKAVGIAYLNSEYIKPVVGVFKDAAAANGVRIVSEASIEKPDQQTTYGGLIQKFTNDGVEVYVPLHDPISTARIVTECGAVCQWTYTFSNFAHESDVALTLFGGKWGDLGVRGLAGGCYYLAPQAYDPSKCGAMNQAHDQWVAINGEESWRKDGQGGASGYQIVYFWVKAMQDAGRDLTRERFVAALQAYEGYGNLISSPITFKGRSSYSHGSDLMVVFEAQTNETYKQLSPGFTNQY